MKRMHELSPAGITTTELLAIVLGSGIQGRRTSKTLQTICWYANSMGYGD